MTKTAILIVEDEKIIAKGIEKHVRALGYVVAGSASTGLDAVQKAAELRPDLILMDISLGAGIDGVEAAELIQKQLDVPVVYLTANSDEVTLHRAKLTGPHGFVLKPYEDRDLQTAIEIGLYRHSVEQRLRQNEQWLAATLGSIGDGVIATDELGRVRFMNTLAERLTGWTQAAAFERKVDDVFRIVEENSRETVANPVLEALANGEPVTLAPNTILIDKVGVELPIEDSAAPIRGPDQKLAGAVLVFRDVTERRRLEHHLRQAQKMEAIGRLAGGIAHDFNNIMTIITGFSEILLDDHLPLQERHAHLQSIRGAGKRAADLVKQIMAFSRTQMLVPCVLNLNTVLRDMETMVKRLIGSNIELHIEMARDLGSVKADPTQVGQVILNLLANARDALRSGGRVIVSTANVEISQPAGPHPDAIAPGRYAMLSIADDGAGMSDEISSRIFEPFFTTKEVGQGTGLGLATVYGIVKQSGGSIEVSSKVGQGTTFRVYLPIVDAPETAPPSPDPLRAPTGGETILLVEDEPDVRLMTRMLLQRSGYTMLEASDGRAAVLVAEKCSKEIHLLITDLVMPHVSGRELADRLTTLRPGLKVLFMSGYTDDVVVHQGVLSASANFLHKPFSIGQLTQKVREILDLPR